MPLLVALRRPLQICSSFSAHYRTRGRDFDTALDLILALALVHALDRDHVLDPYYNLLPNIEQYIQQARLRWMHDADVMQALDRAMVTLQTIQQEKGIDEPVTRTWVKLIQSSMQGRRTPSQVLCRDK